MTYVGVVRRVEKKLIICNSVDLTVLRHSMRRKKEQKMFCSIHAKSFKTLQKIKLFINVYNAAHETLNLLGQGGY